MIGVIGTPDIKVLTGVRRSGKSKLLEALKAYVQKNNSNANIIHINFNLSKYDNLKEYRALNEYIESRSPFDKAGGYGIQDEFNLVKSYSGSFNNIVGLPVEVFEKELNEIIKK